MRTRELEKGISCWSRWSLYKRWKAFYRPHTSLVLMPQFARYEWKSYYVVFNTRRPPCIYNTKNNVEIVNSLRLSFAEFR